tara:strand:- start:455 stop:1366 length:912 start_codon:yes stop_codon:yes gene_type:complete
MRNFQQSVQDHKGVIFCYGSVVLGRNSKEYQIFCSVRPEGLALRTNYAFEITTIANASPDILNNDYMSLFKYNTISHNFSVFKDRDCYVGTGGVSMPRYILTGEGLTGENNFDRGSQFGEHKHGIYMLKSTNLGDWSNPVKIIDRDWGLKNNCCSFDSQSSLLRDGDIYHLYARWNPASQVRKLQVFTTNNIDKWENNAQEVKFDKNINIYTQYIFKHQDKFVAVLRYYCGNDWDKRVKGNHKICIATSEDGANFTIIDANLIEDYDLYIHGDPTQGHKTVNGNPVIYLLCQSGKLTEYEIMI